MHMHIRCARFPFSCLPHREPFPPPHSLAPKAGSQTARAAAVIYVLTG